MIVGGLIIVCLMAAGRSAEAEHQQNLAFFQALVDTFNGLYVNENFYFDYDFGNTSVPQLSGDKHITFFSNVTLLPSSSVTAVSSQKRLATLDLKHNKFIAVSLNNGDILNLSGCVIRLQYTVDSMILLEQQSVSIQSCESIRSSMTSIADPEAYQALVSKALSEQARLYFSFDHLVTIDHRLRFQVMRQAAGVYMTWQQ